MIYLDNAATSYPKPHRVIAEVTRCLKKYCGNPGRSSHSLSIAAAEKIYQCRENICELLLFDRPERIIFTHNATHALNIAIKGLIQENCHVITSDFEHNSVIRPLTKTVLNLGGEISTFDTNLPLDTAILPLIKHNTKYIVCSACSNVTGKIVDIYSLSCIAKKYGLGLIIDGSQSVGHNPIDLRNLEFDALCFPGHKALLGMQGSGVLVLGNRVDFDTLYEGGSGSDTINTEMPVLPPERYEAGTPSTPAIAALCEGVSYINDLGIDYVEQKIVGLTDSLYDRLSCVRGITVYGCENGIASFNINGYNSNALADILDKYGICARSGLHCAPSIHRRLGTLETGALRVSLSIFNRIGELDRLYKLLCEM